MKAYRALFLATLGLATFGTALAQPRLDPRIIPPLITPTQPAPNLIVDVCNSPRVSAFIGYPANATSAADFVEKLYGGYRQDGCPSRVLAS